MTLDLANTQRDGWAVGRARGELGDDDIGEWAGDLAAGVLDDQPRDEVVRKRRGVEVCAALEAVRGVCMQAVAARAGANRGGIEPCGLDEDVLRGLGDARVPSAHHAGEAMHLLLIGDDEVISGEGALGAVEQMELLPRAGEADDDAAGEFVEIEDVRGLAHGEPTEVGGIDRRGDGLLAERGEGVCENTGALLHGDSADDARGEAAAELAGFDAHRECRDPTHRR